MAIRFHAEFRNIRKELYKVEIHDNEFSGSSTEFTLRGDGFSVNFNGGANTYDLIKASTVSFIMNVDDSIKKALSTDLAESDDGRFNVKILKDGVFNAANDFTPDGDNYTFYWLGQVNKKLVSIKDSFYPFDFKIQATDGVDLLKKIDYKDDDGNVITERSRFTDILSDIIGKLDNNSILSDSDVVLSTKVRWYETNMSTSDDPVYLTAINRAAFTELDDLNNVVKFKTYYDVLVQICKIFQCRFVFSNGKYTFIQYWLLADGSTHDYFNYQKDGTFDSNTTEQLNSAIGEYPSYATNKSDFGEPGLYNRTKKYGNKLGSVKIDFNPSDDGNIYQLGYFPVWQMPNANWQPYGQDVTGPNLLGYFEDGDDVSFKLRIKMKIKVTKQNNVTPTQNFFGRIIFPFWLKVESSDSVAPNDRYLVPWLNANITPDQGEFPTNIYTSWDNNGSETDIDNAIVFKSDMMLVQTSASDGTVAGPSEFDVEIDTNISTVSEAQGIFLYNDYYGSWDSALGGGDWFAVQENDGTISSRYDSKWDGYDVDVEFESIKVYPYKDGEIFAGSVVDSYVTDDDDASNNTENLVIADIIFNDGPITIGNRALWVWDGYNFIQTNLWQVNGTGTSHKIHKLITDDILYFNYRNAIQLEATLIEPPNNYSNGLSTNPSIGFNRWYEDEDGSFVVEILAFNKMSYNPNKAQWSFSGTIMSSIVTPVITTEYPDTNIGYDNTSPIITQELLNMNIKNFAEQDSISVLNEILSPLNTSLTQLTVKPLTVDITSDTELMMVSNNAQRLIEKVTVNTAASKGDTTIYINSFTPSYVYTTSSRLIPTKGSLIAQINSSGGSPGGSSKQVQFNDSGAFGGADFLEIDKTSKNLNILGGGDIVLDSDVDGGSGVSVIQYPDDYDGTNRAILTIHNPDIVALSNRARNGTVQIRANGSSAGSGDEEIVAIFTDTALKAEKPIVLKPDSVHPTSTTNTLYNLDGFPYFDKDGLTRTKKIGITIAQYKALETTSIELIAAPGSGYKICVSGIMIFADRTSTETSSNNLYIGQSSPSTTGGNYTGYLRDFMNNETGDRTYNCPISTGEISQGNTDNRALQVYAGGSGFNGDVELDIYVTYSIIES